MYQRVLVFAPVVFVHVSPVAGDVTLQERAGAFAGSLQFSQSSRVWPRSGQVETGRLSRPLQETRQLRRRPELRDRIELFERRREGVAQAPHRPRLKLFVLRRKIQIVDRPGQVLRHLQVGFNEGAVDDHLGRHVVEAGIVSSSQPACACRRSSAAFGPLRWKGHFATRSVSSVWPAPAESRRRRPYFRRPAP